MGASYLMRSRHGTTYHFRRRVPDDLRPVVGKPYLVKSLSTERRREAIILARALAARTDDLFLRLRTMPYDASDDGTEISYALSFKIDRAGRKQAVATDVKPGEAIDAAVAVAALQSHLDGDPLPVQPAPVAPSSRDGRTISQAWQAYKAEKIALGEQGAGDGWKDGENTAKYDHWPHVRTLIDLIGDKAVADVTAEDVNRFQAHVLTDEKGGAPLNRDKRLTRAGALFRWAKRKRTWGVTDDFAELFRYPGKIQKNPYLKFDRADLVALFESDEYRNGLFKTPSEYWLPILGLHTGGRLNELCQLTVGDIGNHDGVPTIAILDEEIGKRLKTTASRRIIPIHSKLIELGFLDYVASVKADRIFPELPEDPARPGNFGAKPSELFTAYRRKCGVGKIKGRSNKAYHSFRSTLIDALRRGKVPKDRRTRLAGHEYDDTQDTHYNGGDFLTMFDFETLKADIETAKFDINFAPYRR